MLQLLDRAIRGAVLDFSGKVHVLPFHCHSKGYDEVVKQEDRDLVSVCPKFEYKYQELKSLA